MISKADILGGGASKVATQLTEGLSNQNLQVEHFTRSTSKKMSTIPLYTDFEKKIYHRLLDIGIQEYLPFERKVLKKYDALNGYDIFHFHDITTAVSPFTLKYLSDRGKKIIWTIHDCSIVTGGCLYPLECKNYLTKCKNCPQLNSFGLARNFDFTHVFHRMKKYVLKNSNIKFIAPSKWIAELVYETGYLKEYPTIIPNGVDTSIFRPLDKKETRSFLGLKQNRFTILLSSVTLKNRYKGLKYAIEVIHKLKKINPYILIVGNESQELSEQLQGFDTFFTGFIQDDNLLNKYYASADIFLNTTIADNQPLVVLEAMAGGTPNFGFATGGIPEIITNGLNGYISEQQNIEEIVKKIIFYSNNQDILNTMSKNAVTKVLDDYSMNKFLSAHFDFYKDTLLYPNICN